MKAGGKRRNIKLKDEARAGGVKKCFHSPSPLHIPEEKESGSVWTREWEWQNETAGVETICLLSWHSGMIIHFNGETWECFYEGVDTRKGTWAILPHAWWCWTLSALFSQNLRKELTCETSQTRWGGGVDCERSAGNYGRRQFRSNQREIWRGLGRGLIGAGTRLCIHLSRRGLHRQSSPSWPNQSPALTPTSIIPIPSFSCIPKISHQVSWTTTKKEISKRGVCIWKWCVGH